MESQSKAVKNEKTLSIARNDFEDIKHELSLMSDQFNKVKHMIITQKK